MEDDVNSEPAVGKTVAGAKPPPPKASAGAVDYNGARIYRSKPRKTFRIILTAGVYSTEVNESWGADYNAAWRWIVAFVAVLGTAFFGFAAAVIKGDN